MLERQMLEEGRVWRVIDRRLGLFRSRRSLGERLLVDGDRGWTLLCRGRLCRRRRRIAADQHPVRATYIDITYILVDTEHFKVDRLGPLGIIKDIIRRNIETPWFLMLPISTLMLI